MQDHDRSVVYLAHVLKDKTISEVVSGCARGADMLGEHWANINGIPVRRFPANWDQYGKRAGILRNQQMADYADCAVVFWDGKSRGTNNMIDEMQKRGKPYYVHYFNLKPV